MEGFRMFCLLYIFLPISLLMTVVLSESLYSNKDNIVLLNSDSFNRTVLGTSHAWVVEFYSSWCGHCIRYAPVYKQLAQNVKNWYSVVRLGAVDCAAQENTVICREYSIGQYPTMVWLPSHATGSKSVINVDEFETVDATRHSMIKLLENNFDTRTGSDIAAVVHQLLQPLSSAEVSALKALQTYQVVLIAESKSSYIGREVILDLLPYRELLLRRTIASKLFPAGLYTFGQVSLARQNRLSVVELVESRKDYVEYLLTQLPISASNNVHQMTDVDVLGELKDLIEPVDSNPYLHQQDLESSLHYSLRHEIALQNTVDGEQLVALKKYVEALAKYLPVRQPIKTFLHNLLNWIQQEDTISGSHWLHQIEDLQTESSNLPESLRWTGCLGSDARFRGYPCSLWMTFHALLVSAAATHDESMDAKEVLLAIRGYVKYFFGCRECSVNFMRGAIHMEERVRSDEDAVLFLWRSHNKANFHLSGDATEDPQHPKVQFPTAIQCPPCHRRLSNGSDSWDERQVLKFLIHVYAVENIVMDAKWDKVKPKNKFRGSWDGQQNSFTVAVSDFMRQDRWHGASILSRLDVSLCLAFYLVCTGVIGILYWRFCRCCRLRKLTKTYSNV